MPIAKGEAPMLGLRSSSRFKSSQVLALGLAAALAAQTTLVRAADVFTVTSPAFKDGDLWPNKYARPNLGSPSPCMGEDISPPVAWVNAPANTKTFALVMYDIDGGNGLGSVHWVAYDIPPTKTSFAEGEAMTSPKGFVGGVNNGNNDHYYGPCGPAGHAPHHYAITVIATDLAPGTLKPGMKREELLAALRGHTLDGASIIGRYGRP
jgi:Raf kinase inhibitor-like YbhB/YbcL family protein